MLNNNENINVDETAKGERFFYTGENSLLNSWNKKIVPWIFQHSDNLCSLVCGRTGPVCISCPKPGTCWRGFYIFPYLL